MDLNARVDAKTDQETNEQMNEQKTGCIYRIFLLK